MSPFSAIDYESLMHWSAELSRKGSLHLSDGSSERVKLPSILITCSLHFAYSRVKKSKSTVRNSKAGLVTFLIIIIIIIIIR